MIRPVVLFVGMLLVATTLTLAQSGNIFIRDSLDGYIRRGMTNWQIPGLAIAVIKDGKVIISKGYGSREVGRQEPVDENTLFLIASNSKLFTGSALANLEAQGKLSLNDKVTKYLPDFRLYDSAATQLVTVRDLLCHRLGTKTFQGDFSYWDSDLSRAEIIRRMRLLKPAGQFRQDYGYCNSAFLTAGEIIPVVTGQSWQQYVEQNLVRPLGMTNTYTLMQGAESRPNVARPYTTSLGALQRLPYDQIDNLGGAGSMVSCVKDLSRWLMMQLDSGRLEGKPILPWTAVRRTRDANTLNGSRKSSVFPTHYQAYGLGVFQTDYAGRQVYWHTGGVAGFVTNVCFVPEEKLAITILTNNDNQEFFEALRYQILDAYLGVPYTDRSADFLKEARVYNAQQQQVLADLQTRVQKHNTLPLPSTAYTGTFTNALFGTVTIQSAGSGLRMSFEHHPTLTAQLDYMDHQTFRLTYSNPLFGIFPLTFEIRENKAVAFDLKVSDFIEYDPYRFVR